VYDDPVLARFAEEVASLGLADTELVQGILDRVEAPGGIAVLRAALAYVTESRSAERDAAVALALARERELDELAGTVERVRRDPRNVDVVPARRLLRRVVGP